MGRLKPSILWRLDFYNFNVEKQPSSYTFSRTKTLVISTSLKYSGRLWHKILKDEMVHHN